MRTQLSLVQAIGFYFVYMALGFLYPIVSISLNRYEAAPFWIVTSGLSVLLIGLVLACWQGASLHNSSPHAFNGWGLAYSPWCFTWKAICSLLTEHHCSQLSQSSLSSSSYLGYK
jgi:hypothetical protein